MGTPRFTPPLCTPLYNGTPTSTVTPFLVLDTNDSPFVSAFGSVAGAATITAVYSNDGNNWYTGQQKQVLAGAASFGIDFTSGARFIGLITSALVQIQAVISAKG